MVQSVNGRHQTSYVPTFVQAEKECAFERGRLSFLSNSKMGDVPNDVKDLDATKALSLELDKPF
jgi:hypothetical protein